MFHAASSKAKAPPCARCGAPAEWVTWGRDVCTACHKAWRKAAAGLPRDEVWGPRPEQRWVSSGALAGHAEAFFAVPKRGAV